MIKYIVYIITFFCVFFIGWKLGKEPNISFWRQMESLSDRSIWRCNSCGRQAVFIESNPEYERLYYCPGCGAKMKNGVK